MEKCPFRVNIDKDHIYEFNTYAPNSITFEIECDLEGKPITIDGTCALPPGFTIHYPKTSAKKLTVKVRYAPAENGVRRTEHVGGQVVLRVVYIDGDGCTFKLNLEMMTDSGPDPLKITECGLCHAEFNRIENVPKVLACGHTYCLSCLKLSKAENDRQNKLRADQNLGGRIAWGCPMDRKHILQDPGVLPTNRLILDSVDKLVEDREKEAAKVVADPFMPCYEDHRHESDVWCQDCKQPYCKQCAATAHSSKMMKTHKRVPVEEMPILEIPLCPIHPEKSVTFVCLHPACSNKIYCTLCQKAKSHKGHKFTKIEDLIKVNKETLEDLHSRLSVSVDVLKNRSEGSEKSFKSFMDKGKSDLIRKSIETYHDRKRRAALDNYDKWIAEKTEELQDEHIKCSTDWNRQKKLLRRVSNKRRRKDTLYDIREIMEENLSGMTDEQKTYPILTDYDFPDGMVSGETVVMESNEDRIPVDMLIEREVEPPPRTILVPREPVVYNPVDPEVVHLEDDDDGDVQIIAH